MSDILITGGESRLARQFQRLYPSKCRPLSRSQFDITDKNQISKVLNKFKPEYLLNCAALTDIEYCEKNKSECITVNSIAPLYLESVCISLKIKFIHVSSDYAIHATNMYGLSKHIPEQLLDLKSSLIIRSSFYDANNYIVKSILNDESFNAYYNVYFNPVSSLRLSHEIFFNKKNKGILNIFSSKKLSKKSFALKAIKVFGKKSGNVIGCKFRNNTTNAIRPLNSYVESNVNINLEEDLKNFKEYLPL